MAAKVSSRAKASEKHNENLFPLFIEHLGSSSLNEYSTTAEKLASWLSVGKAYYPKARPSIVQMLETAHDNVCRQTGLSPPFHVSRVLPGIEQWTQPYLKLVRTVVPFYTRFPEEGLRRE
ncbi:hypothetical protein C8T65DRAFT_53937 [Cerioporus squamosus]|nr:hypothetical protein C8T65DRAFT_53937 [Cerioporus squamosus]